MSKIEGVHMSLENASGGFTDLDELAREGTLVVFRIKQFHPEEIDAAKGFKSNPVTADLLICSGDRAGEVVRGMKVKKGGVTATLRRSAEGKDVAGAMVVRSSDKRPQPFAALDPCDAEQLEKVKKVYRDGVGFDANDKLVSAVAAPAGKASGPVDEDPPF